MIKFCSANSQSLLSICSLFNFLILCLAILINSFLGVFSLSPSPYFGLWSKREKFILDPFEVSFLDILPLIFEVLAEVKGREGEWKLPKGINTIVLLLGLSLFLDPDEPPSRLPRSWREVLQEIFKWGSFCFPPKPPSPCSPPIILKLLLLRLALVLLVLWKVGSERFSLVLMCFRWTLFYRSTPLSLP